MSGIPSVNHRCHFALWP